MAVIFVPVLEADDRLENLPLRAIPGPRPLEMPSFLHTMVTKKRGMMGFQGGVRITALFAKRPLDPHGFLEWTFRPGKGQVQGAFAPVSGEMEG